MRSPLTLLRDARLARLLTRSQRGDREALRELYRSLYPPVCRYVRGRVGSAAEAEDVVSQVFLRLVARLHELKAERGTVLAYVLRSARNLLVDRARAAGSAAREPLSAVEGLADPDRRSAQQELEREEQTRALRARLAQLTPEARELLRLRFADELGYAEIAALLELSEAAVRQRVSRALRELREGWPAAATRGVPTP